ncbi:MAG TPA: PIN domain-containing protein [Candidatus Brocadiales bacterium]|nr:PIN domain-containing protein [Candidatus Brocadiales bacterium]
MIYCLDTDILIEYLRGNEKIKRRIQEVSEKDSIVLTWFSFYELFKGIFATGKLEEETFLQRMAKSSKVLESSYESARIGGEIYANLKRRGQLINDADILIASIVRNQKAVLVTNNEEHFSRINGLRVENWLKS